MAAAHARGSFLERHGTSISVVLVLLGLFVTYTFVTFAAFAGNQCVGPIRFLGLDVSCDTYWTAYALASLVPGMSATGFVLWALVLRHLPYRRLAAAARRWGERPIDGR